jgi:hypothetical protein
MTDKSVVTDKTSTPTSASQVNKDLSATYANQRPDKDKSHDKVPGLTTLDVEVGVGGSALLLGGGYVAFEGLKDVKSLNAQLGSLNGQIGSGLTGLESQLPDLKLGLTTGLTELGGVEQQLGALNTNLTTLGGEALTGLGAKPTESTASISKTAITSAPGAVTEVSATTAATKAGAMHSASNAEQLGKHGQMFQEAVTKGEPIHGAASHLTLMAHADFRSALESGSAEGSITSSFHGLGTVGLKEKGTPALYAKGATPEVHAGIAHAGALHAGAIHAGAIHAGMIHAGAIRATAIHAVRAPMIHTPHVKA